MSARSGPKMDKPEYQRHLERISRSLAKVVVHNIVEPMRAEDICRFLLIRRLGGTDLSSESNDLIESIFSVNLVAGTPLTKPKGNGIVGPNALIWPPADEFPVSDCM